MEFSIFSVKFSIFLFLSPIYFPTISCFLSASVLILSIFLFSSLLYCTSTGIFIYYYSTIVYTQTFCVLLYFSFTIKIIQYTFSKGRLYIFNKNLKVLLTRTGSIYFDKLIAYSTKMTLNQCCGAATFLGGSGSGWSRSQSRLRLRPTWVGSRRLRLHNTAQNWF